MKDMLYIFTFLHSAAFSIHLV